MITQKTKYKFHLVIGLEIPITRLLRDFVRESFAEPSLLSNGTWVYIYSIIIDERLRVGKHTIHSTNVMIHMHFKKKIVYNLEIVLANIPLVNECWPIQAQENFCHLIRKNCFSG